MGPTRACFVDPGDRVSSITVGTGQEGAMKGTFGWLIVACPAAGMAGAQDLRSAVIPKDVAARVMAMPAASAARFRRKPNSLGAQLSQRPPARVRGFNSRMDDTGSVEGARVLEPMTADLSEAAAYAFVSRDAGTKSEIVNLLAHLARAGALADTRSRVRGGEPLSSCTEWTRSDGRDASAVKDISPVQMAAASMQRGGVGIGSVCNAARAGR